MTTYEGPATVVADGNEFPVDADLTLTSGPGLREWYGNLATSDEEATWRIQEASTTTIQINDGPAASFIATAARLGGTEVRIQGSGAPPFGA
ncbi:DUF4873 domain-containing protein [Streptomyces zaomyceticus]|uniref:DUF4873 domain-containing protein n=1 Tax=Streptomyces zaomyceticus TaxID=68286 RepID=UPI00369DC2DB